MENKHKGITLVVALIAAVSLLSLGAGVIITPAYAGGDDGVKQKAEAVAECDQKSKVEDGSTNVQTNTQALCAAISANLNDIEILSGGGPAPPPT